MKKIEITIIIVAIVGVLMKLFHIPLAGITLTLALSSLATFYFWLGTVMFNGIPLNEITNWDRYKQLPQWHLAGGFLAGWSLSVVLIGTLFRIQYWPGAFRLLEMGFGVTVLVLLVSAIRYSSTKSDFYRRIITRAVAIAAIGAVFLFSPKYWVMEMIYRGHPEYIEARKHYMENPEDSLAQKNLDREWQKMHNDE